MGDGTLPPAGTGGLQAVALQGTAQGTYAAFAALLDDLAANYPALQLRSFTVSESAWLTAAGGAGNPGGVPLRADRLHV